jgi:hypothetical protein
MPELYLHQRRIESIFSLLGEKENDVTYSIGWALSRCPQFLQRFLQFALGTRERFHLEDVVVALQEFRKAEGITDIEIRDSNLHVIAEAKRGWALPTEGQLAKYVPRFKATKAKQRVIITMSECSSEYARHNLPPSVDGVAVRHIGWREIAGFSYVEKSSHAEKRLMQELRNYLATIVTMQKQESNWVYVVVLNRHEWAPGLNFIEVVEKRRRYFHPYDRGGWPKEAPNYMGFRYDGRLQSIHHVEGAEVIRNFHRHFPEYPDQEDDPHFLYRLGPPIRPPQEVKTGKIFRNGRKWAMLDLLLTSKTISDASVKSYKRTEEI